MRGLSSWTSVAILRFCVAWCSTGASRGCPDMARLRDHTAITSGDASTTRRKVSVPECPVTRRSLSLKVRVAILIVVSCTDSVEFLQPAADFGQRHGGFVKRRHRFVNAKIRGVSHHRRIVAYPNALKTVVTVTTSSLLSVTGQYIRFRSRFRTAAPRTQYPWFRSVQRGTGTG